MIEISFMQNLLIILLIPLLSAVLITFFLRSFKRIASMTSLLIAFLIVIFSFRQLYIWNGSVLNYSYTWFKLDNFTMKAGFLFDYNTALLLSVVSFIGFWIHFFSLGYMKYESSKSRFFAGLSFFMFSMLGIVLSDNLFMIFVFWELVGLSSYMLIVFYYKQEKAVNASKKAFIVNRIGDFGFIIGIIWTYVHFGTVNLIKLELIIQDNPTANIGFIAMLLMCGFIAKSAQFPLHVWLPDAMTGPTPASALIHAATMVSAGIYFLCRINFIFSQELKIIIMWLGIFMAIYAAFCAFIESNIKKILAYSTLSQIGYMAIAYGAGYPNLALFHLTTHAFFKSLLFLAAGSIIRACNNQQNIFQMGGLLKKMPITSICFFLGMLSLCGVTYTAGYYSKDIIIESIYFIDSLAYFLVFFATFLTTLYMGRLFWTAFLGKPTHPFDKSVNKNNFFEISTLLVLAIGAIFIGHLSYWPKQLVSPILNEYFYIKQKILTHKNLETYFSLTTIASYLSGLLFTFFYYQFFLQKNRINNNLIKQLNKNNIVISFLDTLYLVYVKKIQQRFVNILNFSDQFLISCIICRGFCLFLGMISMLLQLIHFRTIQFYVFWLFLGIITFGFYFLLWSA